MNRYDIPEIRYEDDAILICRKPAGIATQTRRLGQPDMESLLKNYRARNGEAPYIGIVHRLDQPVEGLMVFAKTPEAAGKLSEQIRHHQIGKHYYAISSVAPKQEEGRCEDYLLTDKKTNHTRVAKEKEAGAKKAVLDYRILGQTEEGYLFDICLKTGRQHQIRVQLANLGCPLQGDGKYGGERQGGESLRLCSYRLTFSHPVTGHRMDESITPSWATNILTIPHELG